MAQKNNFNLLYIVGCIFVVVGFITPVFEQNLLVATNSMNGFELVQLFMKAEDYLFSTITVMIVVSVLCGIILALFTKKIIGPAVVLILSIGCGAFLFCNITQYEILSINKFNHAVGFYLIIAGWIIGTVALVCKAVRK